MHMPERYRVLVIGTTTDYIEWIRNARPGQAVYVTSPDVRQAAEEPTPAAGEEVICDLSDGGAVIQALEAHLETFAQNPAGVACFDCESMALAATVAKHFNLSYPSIESIGNCRSKNLSKVLWRKSGVDCPNSMNVGSLEELVDFFDSNGGLVVIKPSGGSGSELAFLCDGPSACEDHYAILCKELEVRKNNRLYSNEINKVVSIVAETYIEGPEFSCDFFLQGERVHIIRITGKIRPAKTPFGTIGGYLLPASLPAQIADGLLSKALKTAARALQLETCIGMADFIVTGGRIYFLEITPRPGGDCLPFLLRHAWGLDMLSLTVDAAAGRPVSLPDIKSIKPHLGVRLHAKTPGLLKRIEVNHDSAGSRIVDVMMLRRPGHRIVMPPADYESWFLGHVILKLEDGVDPRREYRRIQESVVVEVENDSDGSE